MSLRPSPAYLAVLAAAVACYAALGDVLALLPSLARSPLHVGAGTLGLLVGAPAITGVVARPAGGRLADRRGPRTMLCAGALAMALVGALPLVALSLPVLLVSRLGVGAGEGIMMSATVLWLLRLAGAEHRGRALGHIGLANYAGLALGPLALTAVGGGGHARAALALGAAFPLAGAAAALGLRAVPAGGRADAGVASAGQPGRTFELLAATVRPGAGLLLVNVGYVAVLSFGVEVARGHRLAVAGAVVAIFAGTIVFARTVLASLPDRLGGRRTLAGAAVAEAAGLALFATAGAPALAVGALVVLALGQALAVPALGLLALSGVEPADQGAAAGAFFAWFDAGVGAGGPLVGLVVQAAGAPGGLLAAAGAVALSIPVAAGRRRARRALSATAGDRG